LPQVSRESCFSVHILTLDYLAGGGSQNHAIIQILSDVFGVPVYIGDVPDSAALGAAFRSYHGYVCHANGGQYIPADDVLNDKVTTRFSYKLAASPIEANHKIYAPMIKRYEELERRHVKPL
jgi:sugar (pentulose or hexulose) kinase